MPLALCPIAWNWILACTSSILRFAVAQASASEVPPFRVQREAEEDVHSDLRLVVDFTKDDSSGETAEEDDGLKTVEMVVICIVLLLILLTITFEATKDYVERKANKNMKPIVDKLFGEMTVLGFVSICTFAVSQADVFGRISESLFEGSREELLEVFERVHFSLFFIMVFFVLQVLVLVREAMQTEVQWLDMDRAVRGSGGISMHWDDRAESYRKRHVHDKRNVCLQYFRLLPFCRNVSTQIQDDLLLFQALRQEFILERQVDGPFAPQPKERRVPDDFNFGRYLGACLGTTLTHVVEVRIVTWAFFGVIAMAYYLYAALLVNNHFLVWTWVMVGWMTFLFNIYFEQHLINLRGAFAAKQRFNMSRGNSFLDLAEIKNIESNDGLFEDLEEKEVTHLLANGGKAHLPDWCKVDLESYVKRRSWFRKWIVGGTPNRQQSLYWFDRKGPAVYLLVLQINLIFVGLYCAMHLLEFIEVMWERSQWHIFVTYVILATLPILGIMLNKKHLVSTLSQVCCMGTYRRPQVVASVLREEKTAQVVRAFIIIYKMRRFAASAAEAPKLSPTRTLKPHYSASFSKLEIDEVGKTFDSFDLDKSGAISADEFGHLMRQLGVPMPATVIDALVARLDHDGDGEVSRDEFIQWYSNHADDDDDLTDEQRAEYLFRMFDTNETGELTIGDFKRKLDAMNLDFSVDDVGAIVNELDEDNNGTIGLDEFEHLLARYYPKELQVLRRDNSNSNLLAFSSHS